MRCGGCGSKVGSAILEQVLTRISDESGMQSTVGSQQTEDAAVIKVPPGMQLIQSVDHFSSFIDDPYLFGRIAANHALGDLFAMGIDADSAMVIASVGYGSEAKQAQDLYQLMSGVVETLQQHGTRLIGGHSSESSQMSCGLSVNGFADADKLMFKAGMQPGEALILTKPVGSGLLFAADMRGAAQGRWIDMAIGQMLVSSQQAAHCLRRFRASACTDVTGFGLAGHLFEMARASACAAEIYLERVPLMAGAADLAKLGFESSLQAQNIRIRHAISDADGLAEHVHYPLLFDPQTAGGLLASVAADNAEDCVKALQASGYDSACIIGRVVEKSTTGESLILRWGQVFDFG
jgi:selenide,water dikinase